MRRVRLSPILAPWPARFGQHGVGAAGSGVGFPSCGLPFSSSQVPRGDPESCPRVCPAGGSACLGGGCSALGAETPVPRARTLGGWGGGGSPGVGSQPCIGPEFGAESRKGRESLFSRSPLQAPAFLTCTSRGRRVLEEAGVLAGPRARESLASRGQRDPAGGKGRGSRVGEPPPLSRVDRARRGWERRPAWRRSLRIGSAAFSFFRSPWSAWVHAFHFIFIFGRSG